MSATIGRFGRIDGKRISGVAPGVGLYPNPSALTLRYALPSSTLLGASARVASRAYAPVCSGCRGCRLSGVRSSSDASSPTARTSRFEKRAYGFVAELNRSRLDTDASPGGTAPRPSSGANEVFSAPTRPFVSFSTFRATVSRRGAREEDEEEDGSSSRRRAGSRGGSSRRWARAAKRRKSSTASPSRRARNSCSAASCSACVRRGTTRRRSSAGVAARGRAS